uniref:Uncharacterized protein n=1 Tax=Candidatus Kentrum eta TaxID=2126337 RepID=A0A450VNE0_9GAMM|nr:MAG: hypothetical protein BECKH772A_GA0070896_103222 [Candidatus Kentron sp. H]VFK03500.1 MAG: hypothetical protein BECKH772B_GA0070898_103582 [Candidatus Kentron sp. H]VFK06329.1 MAG: hypothetical protein BECKH772C_GA0070978_103422 [Candidatus Kentron sp. H]
MQGKVSNVNIAYNEERLHQALGKRPPAQVHTTGSWGGARISGVGYHPMESGGHNGAASLSL